MFYRLTCLALFINLFVVRLRKLDIRMSHQLIIYWLSALRGRHIANMPLSRPSVNGVQNMFDLCMYISNDLSLQVNLSKSHCIVVGKFAKLAIIPMTLEDVSIPWVQSIKYHGMVINRGKSLNFNTESAKRSFFSVCNCIY